MLSHFSRVQIFDLTDCSWPGSTVMGFSSEEYWMGYHALLQGILLTQGSNPHLLHLKWILYYWATKESESESCSVVSDSLQPHGLYSPWHSSGKNTGVGSLSLIQGIFQTQGLNPGLPHCRWILYQLSHKGNPRILQSVVYPFSSRSSQPRNPITVSCIEPQGKPKNTAECSLSLFQQIFPTQESNHSLLHWATRETQEYCKV